MKGSSLLSILKRPFHSVMEYQLLIAATACLSSNARPGHGQRAEVPESACGSNFLQLQVGDAIVVLVERAFGRGGVSLLQSTQGKRVTCIVLHSVS